MSSLLGFSVQNFKSFKEAQKISFFASGSEYNYSHILPIEKYRILRSALLYGGNASGKTNLIKAVDFSHRIVLYGLDAVNLFNSHFRIAADCYQRPGVFEYRILVGKTEYSYGLVISYVQEIIVSEWLVRLGKKEKYIYNRMFTNGKSIIETEVSNELKNANDRKRFNIYLNDFGDNVSAAFQRKTILGDLAVRSESGQGVFREIYDIYDFFKNILIIYPNTKYGGISSIASNNVLNKEFSTLLNMFDTGIKNLECKKQAVDFDEMFVGVPKEELDRFKFTISKELENRSYALRPFRGQLLSFRKSNNGVLLTDKLMLDHGNPEDMFELNDESDGTKRLFDLIPLLTFRNNAAIFIDEIERSLHPVLIRTFLSLFFRRMAQTKSYTQLLATTHEISLFDTDLVRQDELWLVKRNEDQSTCIYSLNKYDISVSDDIKKGYLLGKYGAIPDIAPVNSLLGDAFNGK